MLPPGAISFARCSASAQQRHFHSPSVRFRLWFRTFRCVPPIDRRTRAVEAKQRGRRELDQRVFRKNARGEIRSGEKKFSSGGRPLGGVQIVAGPSTPLPTETANFPACVTCRSGTLKVTIHPVRSVPEGIKIPARVSARRSDPERPS